MPSAYFHFADQFFFAPAVVPGPQKLASSITLKPWGELQYERAEAARDSPHRSAAICCSVIFCADSWSSHRTRGDPCIPEGRSSSRNANIQDLAGRSCVCPASPQNAHQLSVMSSISKVMRPVAGWEGGAGVRLSGASMGRVVPKTGALPLEGLACRQFWIRTGSGP